MAAHHRHCILQGQISARRVSKEGSQTATEDALTMSQLNLPKSNTGRNTDMEKICAMGRGRKLVAQLPHLFLCDPILTPKSSQSTSSKIFVEQGNYIKHDYSIHNLALFSKPI